MSGQTSQVATTITFEVDEVASMRSRNESGYRVRVSLAYLDRSEAVTAAGILAASANTTQVSIS